MRKPIPKTGESLLAVGLGTWQTFDVGAGHSSSEPLKEVLREFVRLGGGVIDSSPMYGKSESVIGDLAAELGVRKHLFLATKVWTSGREAGILQMDESFKRLRTQRMDLMQVHNLVDYHTQLATLRRWKEQGKVPTSTSLITLRAPTMSSRASAPTKISISSKLIVPSWNGKPNNLCCRSLPDPATRERMARHLTEL
jgi:aryl-alcohol dehydrogenase-like predicted oxidoreductase